MSKSTATIDSEDICKGIASGGKRAGFTLNIPRDLNNEEIELFALMADGVAPLAADIKNNEIIFKKILS